MIVEPGRVLTGAACVRVVTPSSQRASSAAGRCLTSPSGCAPSASTAPTNRRSQRAPPVRSATPACRRRQLSACRRRHLSACRRRHLSALPCPRAGGTTRPLCRARMQRAPPVYSVTLTCRGRHLSAMLAHRK